MPYYINPVTGSVEKITKSQKGALDEYYRSQSLDSLLGSNFGAPTLALSIFVIAAPLILGPLFAWLSANKASNGIVIDEMLDKLNPLIGIALKGAKLGFEASGAGATMPKDFDLGKMIATLFKLTP